MIWLLDTNIVSELSKPRPNPGVLAWLEENKDDSALSEITFGELYYGVHRLPFGKRRSQLLRHISFLREDYRDLTLPFGPAESEAWGEYAAEVIASRGKKFWTGRTTRDSAIATIARAWSLTVVTRDVSQFPFVATLNPFTS
ncbi:MAG TPA: PIN domain-containing protein [Candidatus Saccharimonadales bacterium]|nr:PIN domain-containing protein [Candidatus Saccharimonadales bacterium]